MARMIAMDVGASDRTSKSKIAIGGASAIVASMIPLTTMVMSTPNREANAVATFVKSARP